MKQTIEFHQTLIDLKIYIKNLILYKSQQSANTVAHIKSFQGILQRRLNNLLLCNIFFNSNENKMMSLINYMIRCGEIASLGNGYYMALKQRTIILPISRLRILNGILSNPDKALNVYGVNLNQKSGDKAIMLQDYRHDYHFEKWINIFKTNQEVPYIANEVYYKPTHNGYILTDKDKLIENELYYCISNPAREEKKHYIITIRKGRKYGTFINNNLIKAKLSLLLKQGYSPTYEIKLVNEECSLYKVTLSDALPKTEEEQVYLFSIPKQLKYCKKYYIHELFLKDFISILNQLNFRKKGSE
mgnify:CR=1 FL=1